MKFADEILAKAELYAKTYVRIHEALVTEGLDERRAGEEARHAAMMAVIMNETQEVGHMFGGVEGKA